MGIPTIKIFLPSKDFIQISRRKQKFYRQQKPERIQDYQTSSSTNAERYCIDSKYRKSLQK